jgi:coiled-coil domain-containing protein 12
LKRQKRGKRVYLLSVGAKREEGQKSTQTLLQSLYTSNLAYDDSEAAVKPRNFDPETRTLRKRGADDDAAMEDTVEKKIEGVAEAVVAEDEERRAQELVSQKDSYVFFND